MDQKLKDIIDLGLSKGLKDIELYFSKSTSFRFSIFDTEIDSYSVATSQGVSARGTYEDKMGYVYTEILDDETPSYLIQQVKNNATINEDEDQDKLYKGAKKYPAFEHQATDIHKVSSDDKIKFAKAMERYAKGLDPRVDKVTVYYGDSSGERILKNSYGMTLGDEHGYAYTYINVVAKEGDDIKSTYAYDMGFEFKAFDYKKIASEAVEQATALLNAKTVTSGKMDVIFNNETAGDLLGAFTPIFNGRNVQKNLSCLKGKLGEQIGSAALTIVDDPLMALGMASSPFDDEGYPTYKKTVVDQGVLSTFLHNAKSAKKDGLETTGNGHRASYKSLLGIAPTNFYIEKGQMSQEELIKSVEKGVLITSIAGLHAGLSTVSGDFSLQAQGFLIEDGKVSRPVTQIVVAGNIIDVFSKVEAISNDFKFALGGSAGHIGSPSIKINNLDVSGE